MPRFVVLRHDAPRGLHFDLMLERERVLATWALPEPPEAGRELDADALPDHRMAFLEYEGTLSGGRGSVTRWDRGEFDQIEWSDTRLVVDLRGEQRACRATMERSDDEQTKWRVVFS
jgi:hypothetical protein